MFPRVLVDQISVFLFAITNIGIPTILDGLGTSRIRH